MPLKLLPKNDLILFDFDRNRLDFELTLVGCKLSLFGFGDLGFKLSLLGFGGFGGFSGVGDMRADERLEVS